MCILYLVDYNMVRSRLADQECFLWTLLAIYGTNLWGCPSLFFRFYSYSCQHHRLCSNNSMYCLCHRQFSLHSLQTTANNNINSDINPVFISTRTWSVQKQLPVMFATTWIYTLANVNNVKWKQMSIYYPCTSSNWNEHLH